MILSISSFQTNEVGHYWHSTQLGLLFIILSNEKKNKQTKKKVVNGKAMQYQHTFLPVAAGGGISPQCTQLVTVLNTKDS